MPRRRPFNDVPKRVPTCPCCGWRGREPIYLHGTPCGYELYCYNCRLAAEAITQGRPVPPITSS